jgi:hypothetical protein
MFRTALSNLNRHSSVAELQLTPQESTMADKASFSADEWTRIVGSPFLAGMAVTLADPSGLWGTLKEGMASASALMGAKKDAGAGSLIQAIIAELETSEGRSMARDGFKAQLTAKAPAELKAQAIAALSSVSRLVDAKAGPDAQAFKVWLIAIAERVAAASKEGGFLGFGGVAISDAEKATLEEVSRALRA